MWNHIQKMSMHGGHPSCVIPTKEEMNIARKIALPTVNILLVIVTVVVLNAFYNHNEKLRSINALLSFLKESEVAILVTDTDLNVTDCNDAAAKLLETTTTILNRSNAHRLIPDHLKDNHEIAFQKALQGPSGILNEVNCELITFRGSKVQVSLIIEKMAVNHRTLLGVRIIRRDQMRSIVVKHKPPIKSELLPTPPSNSALRWCKQSPSWELKHATKSKTTPNSTEPICTSSCSQHCK